MNIKLLRILKRIQARISTRSITTGLLLAVVAWQWGQTAAIHAKAVLAQHLIETAWTQALDYPQEPTASFKPWPWADTWPVSRLQWVGSHHSDSVKQEFFILAGSDGSSLAFGPGHLRGTALPGEGASAIAGHRDTHFRFLQHLEVGDWLRVQNRAGQWTYYRTAAINIVNADEQRLQVGDSDSLYLITCYPFDAVRAGGPLRYVVEAERYSFSGT